MENNGTDIVLVAGARNPKREACEPAHRVAALDDEAGHDAVECEAVVEAGAGVGDQGGDAGAGGGADGEVGVGEAGGAGVAQQLWVQAFGPSAATHPSSVNGRLIIFGALLLQEARRESQREVDVLRAETTTRLWIMGIAVSVPSLIALLMLAAVW